VHAQTPSSSLPDHLISCFFDPWFADTSIKLPWDKYPPGPYATVSSAELARLKTAERALKAFKWNAFSFRKLTKQYFVIKSIDDTYLELSPLLDEYESGVVALVQSEQVIFSIEELKRHSTNLREVLKLQRGFLERVKKASPADRYEVYKKHYALKWNSINKDQLCRARNKDPSSVLFDPGDFNDALAWKESLEGILNSISTDEPIRVIYPIEKYELPDEPIGKNVVIDGINDNVTDAGGVFGKIRHVPFEGLFLLNFDPDLAIANIDKVKTQLDRIDALVADIKSKRPAEVAKTRLRARNGELLRIIQPLSASVRSEVSRNQQETKVLSAEKKQKEIARTQVETDRVNAKKSLQTMRIKISQIDGQMTSIRKTARSLQNEIDDIYNRLAKEQDSEMPDGLSLGQRNDLLRQKSRKIAAMRLSIREKRDAISDRRSQLISLRGSRFELLNDLANKNSELSILASDVIDLTERIAVIRVSADKLDRRFSELSKIDARLKKFAAGN